MLRNRQRLGLHCSTLCLTEFEIILNDRLMIRVKCYCAYPCAPVKAV